MEGWTDERTKRRTLSLLEPLIAAKNQFILLQNRLKVVKQEDFIVK